MNRIGRLFLQAIAYAAFAVTVGYFASMPPYRYADAGAAGVKISLSHAADKVAPCVQLTQEEIAEFAANMRRTETCERQRLPLYFEFDVDGARVLTIEAPPSGIWGDGPSSIYERINLDPGRHRITVRLRDTARTEGWDYVKSEEVVLEAARYFTITFKEATGGFNYR